MIKVGLVGYGFMGHMHAQCYEATGEGRVVALADVEADRRNEAAEKMGCRTFPGIGEMLASSDLDMVDICTPSYLHEEHVTAAAGAGRPVLCEKPLSLTVESCDRMIAAVKKAGVSMMTGQVIRFWPEYQALRDIVASGRYGRVDWVSASRLSPAPTWAWQGWLLNPELSGGAVLDLHIHDQDYIAWILGTPGKIQACGTPGPGGAIDSVFSLGWEHPSGAKSYAEGSLTLAPSFPFRMALHVACEKATIKLDTCSTPSLVVYPFEGAPFAPPLPEQKVGAAAQTQGNLSSLGGYFNEIRYFLGCLASGKQPEIVTPETARESVRICLAITESVKSGKAVAL